MQLDPLDTRGPIHLCQPEQERVAPVELVAPERHEEEKPLCLGVPDEKREELPG